MGINLIKTLFENHAGVHLLEGGLVKIRSQRNASEI